MKSAVAYGTVDSCTWCGEQEPASSKSESNSPQCPHSSFFKSNCRRNLLSHWSDFLL